MLGNRCILRLAPIWNVEETSMIAFVEAGPLLVMALAAAFALAAGLLSRSG
jgi:hypothetical protein